MREIKFRTFNGIYMDEVIGYDYNCGGINKDVILVWDKETGLERYCSEDVEMMQFTGLKDNNGKEIFEGDILKCSSIFNQDIINVGLVEFKKGEFKIKWINEDSEVRCDISFWVEDRITEIIGNIYENKELLKALSK